MENANSIEFNVKRWQYNNKVELKNLRTTADLFTYELRNTDDGGKTVAGIAFRWLLTIYAGDIEVIHFLAEEMIAIPNKNISDSEFEEIVKSSYIKAYGEAAVRNINVGLKTSFPPLEEMNIDFTKMKEVLSK